jgi:hypothetical protein
LVFLNVQPKAWEKLNYALLSLLHICSCTNEEFDFEEELEISSVSSNTLNLNLVSEKNKIPSESNVKEDWFKFIYQLDEHELSRTIDKTLPENFVEENISLWHYISRHR